MAEQILTIGDLVATASLDTSVLAGGDGANREVLWAHSCEMPDPARWLGPHELLMTVGLCVPADAKGQVELISQLDEAGLAGIMIGDHEPAPALTSAMLVEADRRGFPVLLAGPQIPYAVIARHVAAANTASQTLQVLTLSKLYHLAAYADDDNDALIMSLSTLLGVGITVVDNATRLPLLVGRPPAYEHRKSDVRTRPYNLKSRFPATLELEEFAGEELDSFLLVHLMKVLEVAVDRILGSAHGREEASAKVMLALLNGAHHYDMNAVLAPHMPSDGFHVVAFDPSDEAAISRLASVQQLPVIVGSNRMHCLALVPTAVAEEFEQSARLVTGVAGVSSTFVDLADARAAAGEAAQAFVSGRHSTETWTHFEGVAISVLPRSKREAQQIVDGVLGALAKGDTRSSMLRETLFAYLRNDRRWAETADELGVHRQTLAYRLRRIEEESGLDLTRLSDLSAAWIAFQAWEVIHPFEQRVASPDR